ncbi:MAG: iron-containing alcohol dehydrogenase, partial [Ruminococcaceae bacterium]|nr:iron-containing alcohol dehydrogenase [Oscillospiraceae bacterium]
SLPLTFEAVGGRVEDIPAMVAHRAEKPKGFPFGGFVKIGPEEMEELLRRIAAQKAP